MAVGCCWCSLMLCCVMGPVDIVVYCCGCCWQFSVLMYCVARPVGSVVFCSGHCWQCSVIVCGVVGCCWD